VQLRRAKLLPVKRAKEQIPHDLVSKCSISVVAGEADHFAITCSISHLMEVQFAFRLHEAESEQLVYHTARETPTLSIQGTVVLLLLLPLWPHLTCTILSQIVTQSA
jgi:hypothetical protein